MACRKRRLTPGTSKAFAIPPFMKNKTGLQPVSWTVQELGLNCLKRCNSAREGRFLLWERKIEILRL